MHLSLNPILLEIPHRQFCPIGFLFHQDEMMHFLNLETNSTKHYYM